MAQQGIALAFYDDNAKPMREREAEAAD